MSELRKVVFYKYEKAKGAEHYEKVFDSNGLFHQFGCDYEQFEDVAASYSTAIIELPDGSIRNVPVELVVFND